MQFPTINNISEVLPHLEGKKEFKVNYRPECTTIDYVYQGPETFSHPILKECRGIKFCPDTGDILARPFHKFFNLGEVAREEVGREFSEASVREKKDGSLIHFILHKGYVVACTKAGITNVSVQAEQELNLSKGFLERIQQVCILGITACFEFTSPHNRIVVGYDRPELTLLAVRDNVTGEYLSLGHYAAFLGVDTPRKFADLSVKDIREWKDMEGVVLEWPDGYRLKLKAEEYVLRHRVKDQLFREHNVLKTILEDGVDDLVGILTPEDWERVRLYQAEVRSSLKRSQEVVGAFIQHTVGMDRGEAARFVSNPDNGLPSVLLPVFWQVYSGGDVQEELEKIILKNCTKEVGVEKVRGIVGVAWRDYFQMPGRDLVGDT